jgi:hypothetical protein
LNLHYRISFMKSTSFILKYYKTFFLLSSISIVAVCCNSTKPVAAAKSTPAAQPAPTNFAATPWGAPVSTSLEPVESDVAIAQAHWPGTTLNDLTRGYAIFDDKCTDCHSLEKPQNFSVDEWNVLMRKMGRKAKLDSNEYKLVFHYILTKREAILGSGK